MLVADWIMAALCATMWPLLTVGRLTDLGLNRWWVLVIALPWAAVIWTVWHTWLFGFLGATSVLAAVQLPLILLPCHNPAADEQTEVAGQ
jgi:uncharacterized membrane protein YhaH (DUF805 family)